MFSRFLSIAVLSLAAVVAGAAEKGTGPDQRPGPNRADYLDKVTLLLDLNAGQKVQVEQLLDEQRQQQRTQMQALREQARTNGQRPDFDQVQKQRLQAEKDLVDKLRPVLTDVQLTKFEALRELTGPRQGPRRHGHRGPPSGSRRTAPLNCNIRPRFQVVLFTGSDRARLPILSVCPVTFRLQAQLARNAGLLSHRNHRCDSSFIRT